MQPVRTWRGSLALGAAAMALLVLFLQHGTLKPVAEWKPLDLAGEGSLALLAAAWTIVVLDSRPGGRVTALMAGGLAALSLAAWADLLDEVVRLSPAAASLGWIESGLAPLGMLVLSLGLVGWRREQFVLAEQLGARERQVRDHRAFDRLTRLADAGYLREQMAVCLKEQRDAAAGGPQPSAAAAVAMLELAGQAGVEREHGGRAAAGLMQSVVQQLLLNLRPGDLLCRYAGDRLVVLMPATPLDEARRRVEHLRQMVEAMQVHADEAARPLQTRLRTACAALEGDPQATLSALGRALDPWPSPVGEVAPA